MSSGSLTSFDPPSDRIRRGVSGRTLLAIAAWLIVAGGLPVLLVPEEWPGYVLFAIIPLILFAFRSVRRDRAVLVVALVSLALTQILALYNVHVDRLVTGEKDALGFHQKASAALELPDQQRRLRLYSPFYVTVLAIFYRMSSPSILLAAQLSVLVFVLSIPLFLRLLRGLAVERWRVPLLALFGLLPSAVMHRAVSLREAWEMAAFLVVALAIMSCLRRASALQLSGVIAACLAMSVWHKALFVLAMIVIAVMALYTLIRGDTAGRISSVTVAPLVVFLMWSWFDVSHVQPVTRRYGADNLAEQAAKYRRSVRKHARAHYGGSLELDSAATAAGSGAMLTLHYFVAPLPWQMTKTIDLYAVAENLLRLSLIAGAVHAIWRRREMRAALFALFLFAMVMEGLWASGTGNWGTAIRHHLVAFPILLAVGGPSCIALAERVIARFGSRRVAAEGTAS